MESPNLDNPNWSPRTRPRARQRTTFLKRKKLGKTCLQRLCSMLEEKETGRPFTPFSFLFLSEVSLFLCLFNQSQSKYNKYIVYTTYYLMVNKWKWGNITPVQHQTYLHMFAPAHTTHICIIYGRRFCEKDTRTLSASRIQLFYDSNLSREVEPKWRDWNQKNNSSGNKTRHLRRSMILSYSSEAEDQSSTRITGHWKR